MGAGATLVLDGDVGYAHYSSGDAIAEKCEHGGFFVYTLAARPSGLSWDSEVGFFRVPVAKTRLWRFCPTFWSDLRAVRAEHSSTRAILRQERPFLRISAILATSKTFLGLPSLFPFARALRSPARTRSQINERSSSATAPKTVKTIFPAGVEVSTPSVRLTNSTPRAWKRFKVLRDFAKLDDRVLAMIQRADARVDGSPHWRPPVFVLRSTLIAR